MLTAMGADYAKMYRTNALREIADWADKAAVALDQRAKECGFAHLSEAKAHIEDQMTFHALARSLRTIMDEQLVPGSAEWQRQAAQVEANCGHDPNA